MYPQQAIVDPGFIVKGLNNTGITQPTDAQRDNFSSEATLDATISTLHAAKDKPHLTLNDKVFAARVATGGVVTPYTEETAEAGPAVPDQSWTREDIRVWLASNGITYSNGAFNHMSKEELLDAVADVLNP